MSDFDKIYNRCLFQECPPVGNDKGIKECHIKMVENTRTLDCRECWKIAFKEVVKGL